jgi:hypothetical protein
MVYVELPCSITGLDYNTICTADSADDGAVRRRGWALASADEIMYWPTIIVSVSRLCGVRCKLKGHDRSRR